MTAPDMDGLREAVAEAIEGVESIYSSNHLHPGTCAEHAADAALAVVRPLLDAEAERVENLRQRVLDVDRHADYWRKEAQDRIVGVPELIAAKDAAEAEVAALTEQLAETRGEATYQRGKARDYFDRLDRVKALADDMDERGAASENDSHLDTQSRRQIREDAARLRGALGVPE